MRLLIRATLLLTAPVLLAQQPVFKARTDLVTIPVIVNSRDRDAQLNDLIAADFELRENGDRQQVSVVTRERRPVSLAIVLDSSGSMDMDHRRSLALESARRALGALAPGDEAAVVLFAQQPEVVVPWTTAAQLPQVNWQSWKPFGWSAVIDGFRAALALMDDARNPNRVVLMITDGFENSSRASLASVAMTRRQSEVTVYGLAIGALRTSTASRTAVPAWIEQQADYMESFVNDSGGMLSYVNNASELVAAIQRMSADWNNQYTLGYTPSKPFDGKYRKIKVEAKRRGVSVRHRGGYLALPAHQ